MDRARGVKRERGKRENVFGASQMGGVKKAREEGGLKADELDWAHDEQETAWWQGPERAP